MRARDEIGDVLAGVTGFYGVSAADVFSQRRSRDVHKARCIGMYLAKMTGADSAEIGRRFGGRDYRIVDDVCRDVASTVKSDDAWARVIRDLHEVRETATRTRAALKPLR